MINIKENDIFCWRYLDDKTHSDYLNYHCKSRYMICRKGVLRDTYWSGMDGFSVKVEDYKDKILLTYIGNLDELESVDKYKIEYYAENDIVNISHANMSGSGFYIKMGAKRCKDKILNKLKYQAEEEKDKATWAERRHKEALLKIEQIENGTLELDKVYL